MSTPNAFAMFILFAWPVLMTLLAAIVHIRKVVLISIIGGNLFLPATIISLPGLPNYTKFLAAGLGALIPAFLFAFGDFIRWRPKFYDLFFLGFMLAPGISSYTNGLGLYDAAPSTVNRFLEWGVAYWLGRALFTDLAALRDLCVAVVASAIIYTPLCFYEMIMSPQLSRQVYGFRPSSFGMSFRFGGWRPMVFMQHGLALAAWMASATLVAWILWRSKAIRNIWGIPISWIAIGLVLVTIGLRSTGAALLLLGLIAFAECMQIIRLRPLLIVLVMLPMGYIGLRSTGWDGHQLLKLAEPLGADRVQSLETRLENDQMIADRAFDNRPVFGWGGWGRWRVRDDRGRDITISDSWWAILIGTTGVFGLFCTYFTFIAPLFPLSMHKTRNKIFFGPLGAAWAIGLGVLLFIIDSLANAMPNTAYTIMAATLVSIYPLVSPKAMKRLQAPPRIQVEEPDADEPPEPVPNASPAQG